MIDLHALMIKHMDEPFASIAAGLAREEGARILWINPEAQTMDPAFRNECQSSASTYRSHILDRCSYLYTSDAARTDAVGYFDRYGGDGMGKNGGSGRAVNVGDYNIKGVGRSALVSPMTDFAHASGYAFVEEALREVMMYEALEKLLPGGVVPVLAIIGIDRYIEWPAGSYPPGEHRVLIVRPRIARPAHLEAADTYIPIDPVERIRDNERISGWRNLLCSPVDREEFFQTIARTYETWASRYAKCLLQRWSLGGLSPSNIDINGRFLDFGGACQISSIGNYAVGYAAWSWDETKTIKRSISSLTTAMLGIASYHGSSNAEAQTIWQRANSAFIVSVMIELGLIEPMGQDDLTAYLKTDQATYRWSTATAAIEYLANIRLPINQPGGPQLEAVRTALEAVSSNAGLFRTQQRVRAHLRKECNQSSSATAAASKLPSRHREYLRTKLHQVILEQASISEEFFTSTVNYLPI